MKKNLTLFFLTGAYTARILKVYKFAFLIFRFARKLFSKIVRFARNVFFLSRKVNNRNCFVIQVGSDLQKILFFFKKLLLELVMNFEFTLLKKCKVFLINKILDLNTYTYYKTYAS